MISLQISTVIGGKCVITHATTKASDMAAFVEPLIGPDGLSDPAGYGWIVTVDGTDLRRLYDCLSALDIAESVPVGD